MVSSALEAAKGGSGWGDAAPELSKVVYADRSNSVMPVEFTRDSVTEAV